MVLLFRLVVEIGSVVIRFSSVVVFVNVSVLLFVNMWFILKVLF